MANLEYIKKSYLQSKVNSRRKVTLFIGIPALIAVMVFGGSTVMPFILVGFIILMVATFSGGASDAGTRGEEAALAILSQLPDTYHIFNDVKIPNPNSGKGFTAIDYVVVGRNGVFVVEQQPITISEYQK